MNISSETEDIVRNFAQRFTDNSPPVCRRHLPEGLPIDAPQKRSVSNNHPSQKFERIVNRVSCRVDDSQSVVYANLRAIFRDEYLQHSDERSCIKCFEKRQESESETSIRMVVPDKYDQIPDQ